MNHEYKKHAIMELAQDIKAHGFRVFIAKSGTYGFYTDADGSRVVSFQIDLSNPRFSGNYKTSNPQQTGTGWGLENGSYQDMFDAYPPRWAIGSASFKYTTLAQHLKTYQGSSNYSEHQEAVQS